MKFKTYIITDNITSIPYFSTTSYLLINLKNNFNFKWHPRALARRKRPGHDFIKPSLSIHRPPGTSISNRRRLTTPREDLWRSHHRVFVVVVVVVVHFLARMFYARGLSTFFRFFPFLSPCIWDNYPPGLNYDHQAIWMRCGLNWSVI